MKYLSSLLIALAMHSAVFGADWSIVSTQTTAISPEEQASKESQDFLLNITLRNDSKVTQYIQGLPSRWFLVEAFIRRSHSGVWERENTGYDQKLTWIAIKPGEEIKLTRRQAVADACLPMMLTFSRALSEGDHTGSVIVLDSFKVPSPQKEKPQSPEK